MPFIHLQLYALSSAGSALCASYLLINGKGTLNIRDIAGDMPQHIAASFNNVQVLMALMESSECSMSAGTDRLYPNA